MRFVRCLSLGAAVTLAVASFVALGAGCNRIDYSPSAELAGEAAPAPGADLVRRCEETFEERYLFMWTGLSNLRLRGWYGYAPGHEGWRWFAPVAGHHFFVGSGWQERSEKLFALAAEVAKATEK